MTILSDRWSGLRKVPHVPLAQLPTPVVEHPALSRWAGAQLWIKRDDQSAARYGGNKVRKLEYVLGEALAREADTLLTMGAAGSHHVLATALFGAEQGLAVHAFLVPQRRTAHVEEQLDLIRGSGATLHALPGSAAVLPAVAALAAQLRLRGRRPYVIPLGGSNVAGCLGHVEAGLELARQLEAGLLPEPDAVVVPLGSGGTAAGLAVGLAGAGVTSRVLAVRVVGPAFANRTTLGALIGRTVSHLRALDGRFPDVAGVARAHLELDARELGEGYGVPTSAGEQASRIAEDLAGLELEPTYTAKAFAATLRAARERFAGGKLLYVHTLSGPPAGLARLEGPRPPAFERLLRG